MNKYINADELKTNDFLVKGENNKCCGNCKHWHERKEQEYVLKIGDCDKIAKGTPFIIEQETYTYDGYSFVDEYYDDCFNCFEEIILD